MKPAHLWWFAAALALSVAGTGGSAMAASGGADLALSATLDGATVQAQGCRARKCNQRSFAYPEELHQPQLERVLLEGGRPAFFVEASGKTGEGRFVLLLSVSDEGVATELLRGWLDRPKGVLGERQTRVLFREPGSGGERVSFATRYEAVNVCGHAVFMHAQRLDAALLEWLPTPTRSLSGTEREAAARLFATRTQLPFEGAPGLLVSTVATSALGGRHAGLTDGTLELGWTENVEGSGLGEAVVMSSSSEVAIDAFQFVLRGHGEPAVAAPRTLFVVTDAASFLVTLPEDAALQPEGTVYEARLAAPLRTGCAAIVLDTAYDAQGLPVGLAEFRAHTTLEGVGGLSTIVAKLNGSAPEARAAEVLLSRSGSPAVLAAIKGFDGLDAPGRERALNIIDGGNCSEKARFHVEHLVGLGRTADWDPDGEETLDALRTRVRGCREESRSILDELTGRGDGDRMRGLAARELAALAPALAVAAVARELPGASGPLRARFRDAFSAAARAPAAAAALVLVFEPAAFSKRQGSVQVELLRALGGPLAAMPGALADFVSAAKDTSFPARYWLQEPAAQLARSGDANAVHYLIESLVHDPSPHIRAQAAHAAAELPALLEPLGLALQDASPRVREAALGALARSPTMAGSAAVRRLLDSDPWTFVRVQAAMALGAQPPTREGTAALLRALDDRAIGVRRAALLALGATRDPAAGERIAEVAEDAIEDTDIRVAAIAALGRTCRSQAHEFLYKLALRTGAPELGYDRELGLAALSALAELRPSDRAERLQPLLRESRAPRQLKVIVRDVIARTGNCGR